MRIIVLAVATFFAVNVFAADVPKPTTALLTVLAPAIEEALAKANQIKKKKKVKKTEPSKR